MRAVIVITDMRHESEFLGLCSSAGVKILGKIRQNVKDSNPRYYIGSGKLEELKVACKNLKPDIVIFDVDLRPSQIYRISKEVSVEVWDRLRLVLEIFRKRASTPEAKLQVELANLRYQIPLIREYINLTKRGEHPGFMGGGEYAVADYLEMVKRRMKRIKEELAIVQRRNESRYKIRKESGFILVSIAGYANAGKSSIAKTLSGYNFPIDNTMFSTVATFTKKIKGKHPIIITDTVGFIRNLPVWVIEAFRTTLKSVYDSDLLLFVVDISETIEDVYEKISSGIEILGREEIPPTIFVLNKIDLVESKDELYNKVNFLLERGILNENNYVLTSAVTGEGLDKLVYMIYANAKSAKICSVLLNRDDNEFEEKMRFLLSRAHIFDYKEDGSKVILKVGIHNKTYMALKSQGILVESSSGNNGGRVPWVT